MELALVYMLAGLSSRFGGKAKGLARIGPNGETLLEYSLNQALPAGFTKIIFIVGGQTEKLFKEKFGNSYKGVPIEYALQEYDSSKRDKPWGTADALCSAKNLINSKFVICNGDDIYGAEAFKKLAEHSKIRGISATIGYTLGNVLSQEGGVNRGIFEISSEGEVKSITETFDITAENLISKNLSRNSLCSMNIFLLTPKDLDNLKNLLVKFKEINKESRNAECLLPQEITNLMKLGKLKMKVYETNSHWFGLTRAEDEEKVRNSLRPQIK